jgi:hypothetical protein
MLTQPLHANFTRSLFWDVDPETIDFRKHRRWVVQRVLEYGRLEDWRVIRELYTLDGVVEAAQQARTLDPKARAFLCLISGKPKDSFRCFTTRSCTRLHWAY